MAKQMYFPDYSQFSQRQPTSIAFGGSLKQFKFVQANSYPIINTNHDLSYLQFTQTISNRFISASYPTNFQKNNPFCPICLKFVENSNSFATCYIRDDRNYLIHQECLKRDKSYQMQNLKELIQNTIVVEQSTLNSKYRFQIGLDLRYFYIELAFTHPINQKNFIKINKKVSLNKDHFNILIKQEQTDSFFPNVILLPMADYHMTVSLTQVGKKENQQKFTKYVSFRNCKQNKRLTIKCEEITLQAEVINNYEQKLMLVELMNYKYRYPINDSIPLLRVYGFKINIPKEFEESDEDFIGSSNIVEQLLNQKNNSSSIKTSQHSPLKNNRFGTKDSNSSHQNQIEKVNLCKLISTNTLVEYVKNNIQSRLFQTFLNDATEQQISLIIVHIQEKMAELITHQYGNYMIQKLFIVCSPNQRLAIITAISPRLIQLAKIKQGTHTIQAFIQHFTQHSQYQVVSFQIMQQFYELCKNNNATHFIQKIIKTFPLQYTIGFFQYITENLVAFALDKNAMCVIKHMMRRLRQLDGTQESYSQAIDHIRRQIILNVTFNVDILIMDSYGNYVIQFCYQLFDLDKCSGITERILSKFVYYSKGKFSSNVLLKCISLYWVDKRVYKSLKSINSKQILDIFRNKDGNKILLQIMEKLQGTQLWDWLYGVLIQVQPARFYHDRWGVCLGSRSGQVGSQFIGFPEGKKKTYIKKH